MNVPSPTAHPGSWELWRLRPALVGLVLAVELAALAQLGLGSPAPTGTPTLLLAAGLALVGVVHTELSSGIERARRRATETSYFDLSSVWTFAAALLLPPAPAAAVVLVVYVHLWHRVWAPAGVPLHRHVYTTATVLLAARAAHEVLQGVGGLPTGLVDPAPVLAVGLAVLVYVAVNTLLVAAALALSGPRVPLAQLAGSWDDNALELATLCMGALAAVALGSTPGMVALVLPPILVLHRAVLVRQLEQEVSVDAKTGLLTAVAWRAAAGAAVARARRCGGGAGLLMLDLDHFKRVNDTHGHLAGDDVLAAVAAVLRAESRGRDVVGRFGGEEFVVLLPDLPVGGAGRDELGRAAERLRSRVSTLGVTVTGLGGPSATRTLTGLTVSIGGAGVPDDGTTLDRVLAVADAALYAAKDAGRDAVRIAPDVHLPAPRPPSG